MAIVKTMRYRAKKVSSWKSLHENLKHIIFDAVICMLPKNDKIAGLCVGLHAKSDLRQFVQMNPVKFISVQISFTHNCVKRRLINFC